MAKSQKRGAWDSIYVGRQRASLSDARDEAAAVTAAIERISKGADDRSPKSEQDLAAGKLFEIANELRSAETAYRRAVAVDPELQEAQARLLVVLGKQRRLEEATRIGHELLLRNPNAVFKSLVYEGPLSLCTLLGDLYRLSGKPSVAASMYREGARLEGGAPYAVNQAILSLTQDGQGREAARFAGEHAGTWQSELLASLVRLSQQGDNRLPAIREAAFLASAAAGMEALS